MNFESAASRPRGLSLPELMVSLFLLSLLGALFVGLFSQARAAGDTGSARIAARAQHRVVQRRLTTLLRSAVPPDEVRPALAWPEVSESDQQVRFFAPANLIDSDAPFDPRLPDYQEFTVRLQAGALHLRRSDSLGPEQSFGRGISSLEFLRSTESTLEVTLQSLGSVRGAAGGSKEIAESSRNLILIPAIR